MNEAKLQSEIIRWLRSKGCYVIKHNAGPGVPVGCADLSFYIEGCYGFIEVKANKRSSLRPLQEEFIKQMAEWSWAKVVSYENWPEVKQELEGML